MQAVIIGTSEVYEEKDLLDFLRDNAKQNCNRCFGRGHTGFMDEMIPKGHKHNEPKIQLKATFYIPCDRCFIEDSDTINLFKKS